jgi:hypothetical protein
VTFLALVVPSQANALTLIPTHAWSQGFGKIGSAQSFAVALDGASHVYLGGRFSGVVDFGGGDLTSIGDDIFLASFDTNGLHQWSRHFGNTHLQWLGGLATDVAGNVYAVGTFYGAVDFGGGVRTSPGTAGNIFVIKYDATGAHQWSKSFGDDQQQSGIAIASDGAGGIYITGAIADTTNFGGGNLVAAGYDAFVAKFNAAGLHQWSKRFGDANGQSGYCIASNGGGVYVGGEFFGTVDFGGGNLTSSGQSDAFLVKFDAAGVHQWSKRFGSTGFDLAEGIALDGAGFVYLTGGHYGTINFGGSDLTAPGDDANAFLAKFSAGGTHNWSKTFGDDVGQDGISVASSVDRVFLVAWNYGTMNFGGKDLVSVADGDMCLAEFAWNGEHIWSGIYGGTQEQMPRSVAADQNYTAYACGYFQGSLDFGGGDLNQRSIFAQSGFLVRFDARPAEPVITSIADVGNDQGRKVRIRFEQSAYDHAGSNAPVTSYEIYRRNDPVSLAARPPDGAPRSRLEAAGWVWAGDVPAHDVPVYLADAPTDADSTLAGGQHHSVFFVRAGTADPVEYFDSPADSGYSVDNLVPGIPGSLVFTDGILTWTAPEDPDLDHFTVYGANTGCACRSEQIGRTSQPQMDVSTHHFDTYVVTATDRAGNEGAAASVSLTGDTEPPGTARILSISSQPNPFNPTTTIRYTLPARGHVSLRIHDARGALVAVLLDEAVDAGEHRVTWKGQDAAGRTVSSGVYFARLQHDSGTRSHKLLLLK